MVFVASEAVPFAKTGGLADVAGALPRALRATGPRRRPSFCPVIAASGPPVRELTATGLTLRIPVGAQVGRGHVYESRLPGSNVRVYLIDQPRYFDRDGLYGSDGKDYDDNCERFVFFNRAVLEAIQALQLGPTSSTAMTGRPA